jgi:hypothetical protein
LLDRPGARSYIAACVALTACRGHLAPLVPELLAPVAPDSIVAWTAPNGPARRVALRFKWTYRDDRRSGGGRGTLRIAPPDSMRIDWASALNIKSGAAVVIGDSLRWADPKEDYPSANARAIQLVWSALGIVRPPDSGVATFGMRDTAGTVWRYIQDRDTVAFRLTGIPRMLQGEWRRAGRVMARSRTQLAAGGLPQGTRVDVPERSARFEITFVAVDSTAQFAPALWRSRR